MFPAVLSVERIIAQAVEGGATGIQVVPEADVLRVYYRIEGALREVAAMPLSTYRPILARLKMITGMDLADLGPQDGKLTASTQSAVPAFVAATLQTAYGEMMVLRVLDAW